VSAIGKNTVPQCQAEIAGLFKVNAVTELIILKNNFGSSLLKYNVQCHTGGFRKSSELRLKSM
jgi:hypothetical protein